MDTSLDEKDLPNYMIYWVDGCQSKHIMLKFKAETEDDAKAVYEQYKAQHDDGECYFGAMHYVRCIKPDGSIVVREMEDHSWMQDDISMFKRVIEGICGFFTWWFWQKPKDWWYKAEDFFYLMKHHEDRSNQWNLDSHLIDTIILNVPSLIEHSHGLMFLDEAILRTHGSEEGFDLREYHNAHCSEYPAEIEKLAEEIQQEEYKKLLLNAKLYKYYSNAGLVDSSDPEEVEFDKEWRHTLPVKPGTYDEFDYVKLEEMHQAAWNNVWDWVKKHGHTLYD